MALLATTKDENGRGFCAEVRRGSTQLQQLSRYFRRRRNGKAFRRFAPLRTTPRRSFRSLLAEHRGRGVGTLLLRELLRAAAGRYEQVSLSVAKRNPAVRLYERFGFRRCGRTGTLW